jgi:hypothetical protein
MLLSGGTARTQAESGMISVTVTDQCGAIVSGATVTAINLSTTSSNSGPGSIGSRERATYQASVKLGNFKPFTNR